MIFKTAPARARRALLLALSAASLSLVLTTAPADAQWFARDELIPARGVVLRLLRQGFTGVSHPRLDGSVYTVDATNHWGSRVRLVIDAYDGDVIARRRIEEDLRPPLDVGPRRYGRADPFDLDGEIEPRRRYGMVERPPHQIEEHPAYRRPLPEEKPLQTRRAEPPRERKAAKAEPPVAAKPAAAPRQPDTLKTSEDAPAVSPPAPAPAVEAARPAPAKPEQASAWREPPPSTEPPRNVRVIEGVTPVPPVAPVPPRADEAKPAE